MSTDGQPPEQLRDLWPDDPGESAALLVVLFHPGTDYWTGQPAELSRQITIRAGFLSALLQEEHIWVLFGEWGRRLEACGTIDLPPPTWARKEADMLLLSLGLPWAWLTSALVRLFFALLLRAAGVPVPGQTLSSMMVDPVLAPPGTKRRRFPKEEGDHLFEWGTWFYRHRVLKEPIRKLAQEIHEDRRKEKNHPHHLEDCGCRRMIQQGLKEADRLFNPA